MKLFRPPTVEENPTSGAAHQRSTFLSNYARRFLPGVLGLFVVLGGGFWYSYHLVSAMPGQSYKEEIPAPDAVSEATANRLGRDLDIIGNRIGERNTARFPRELQQTEEWLLYEFTQMGYAVTRQPYAVDAQIEVANIEAVAVGTDRPEEILVIGAHYDSAPGTPGVNDNGSGVAALLELARHFQGKTPEITVRFVAFVNEEPPFFSTDLMGSRVYALNCKRLRENIVGMIALETIGYYSDEPGSQQYPAPLNALYPNTGDFLAFVGNLASRDFVHQTIGQFREYATLPSEGVAAPENLPGIGFSDHASFWAHGYPALMLTDTAPFRYPYYHTREDTADKIDIHRMALAVQGIAAMVNALAYETPEE